MSIRYTKRAETLLRTAHREALSMGMSTVDTPHIYRAIQREMNTIDWAAVGRDLGTAFSAAFMDAYAEEDVLS